MNLRHVSASLITLAAVAGPIAGCGSSGNSNAATSGGSGKQGSSSGSSQSKPSSGSGSVTISNFKFAPPTLTVKGGAKVAVANHDSTAHTFTADDGHSFDSGDIDPNASATVTVSKPGTYKYHCSIHPFMHGTLVVK